MLFKENFITKSKLAIFGRNNITIYIVQRNTTESKFDLPSLSQTVNFNIGAKEIFDFEIIGLSLNEIK